MTRVGIQSLHVGSHATGLASGVGGVVVQEREVLNPFVCIGGERRVYDTFLLAERELMTSSNLNGK